ncbi:hypothetical protein [Paenibacillus hexagrammi]|uniref:Uncharacterized protein n=1 Tax=Paenibacillus hexagrammi TaxID=2908839 RepID=A0ABY3SLL0_9BACL|nr:hypothetical protein [Paenibacillus sp. YPD9-1]UJF33961.1 hypothetical protein L0M14_01555 [Paenibacillus sp. YPD9-1]
MKTQFFKYGIVLISFDGFLYTSERLVAKIVATISAVPMISNGYPSVDTSPTYPHFGDNIFIPLLLILGIISILYGLLDKEKDK